MLNIGQTPSRKVIEQDNLISTFNEPVS